MRILALAVMAICALSVSEKARAQTYDPNYPVCLQVFVPGNYIDCSYTSLQQCNATASGLAATCLLNPYLAQAAVPMPRYRHRHAY